MTREEIRRQVTKDTLLSTRKCTGRGFVPVGISNRHIHLTQAAVEQLFGPGHQLTPTKALSQPGQFACEEKVTVEGPKGKLSGVRVLGPVRKDVQVELSVTDAFAAGIKPVVRMSGDIAGTPGCRLTGPAGSMEIREGVIVAARHLHISPEQAAVYGLKSGDQVRLRSEGPRAVVFEQVAVRSGPGHDLEVHIDFDEANCAQMKNGDLLEII